MSLIINIDPFFAGFSFLSRSSGRWVCFRAMFGAGGYPALGE
jgi:hypothetical protein